MTQETPPEKHPAQDIGSVLASARKKKKLSLEDVGRALRLSIRYLSAIEENRPEEFPAPVYYRGSVQSCCEFLDVEFGPLWRQANPEPPLTVTAKPVRKAPTLPLPKISPSLVVPATLFGLLVIAAGTLWLASRTLTEVPRTREVMPPKIMNPVAPVAVEPPAPKVETPPIKAAPPAKKESQKKLLLRIESRAQAWVRLKIDKKQVSEALLPAGSSTSWEADKSFGLRSPRPDALRVWLNEQEIDLKDYPKDIYDNILLQPVPVREAVRK